ncbi:MAG: uroporphyrinogen-III synthase [Caulobacteraceae bacterium]
MRIWITRAEPGASRTADKLRALGHQPVVAPLLEVHALPGPVDLDGVGALAFTSANGVRAFAERAPDPGFGRALPVFTVGDATAAAARAAGFADVASASGDLDALADLIAAHARRFRGTVLAPGPREPAGDLCRALAARGVTARAQALYETLPVFPRGLGQVDAVLVHSPKAGERLALVLGGQPGPAAFCISAAAAAPLAGHPFARVEWAARPDEDSLLALLPPP